jgi:CRP-like cAMP-binding protein
LDEEVTMNQSALAVPDEGQPPEIGALTEMPVFGGVSTDALVFLIERADDVRVPGEEFFFREGETGGVMYVLRAGRVELQRFRDGAVEILGQLGPGDCFGEMALLDLYPRSASVKALEDCSALAISHGLLYELYGQSPEPFTMIMMNLARELSRRLREAHRHVVSAYNAPPRSRRHEQRARVPFV